MSTQTSARVAAKQAVAIRPTGAARRMRCPCAATPKLKMIGLKTTTPIASPPHQKSQLRKISPVETRPAASSAPFPTVAAIMHDTIPPTRNNLATERGVAKAFG